MTARDRIKQYLNSRHGFVLSTEIHNHIVSQGYMCNSSAGTLAKMVERGELIRTGENHNTAVRLNPDYVASALSIQQTENHAGWAKEFDRVPGKRKPKRKSGLNDIFDLCREHSNIYRLIDQPLREVRV